MSDIQVPDEVIEEAANTEWNASESRTFDGPWDDQDDGTKDMWRRGPLVSAPIIAAWARKQALKEAQDRLGSLLDSEDEIDYEESNRAAGINVALAEVDALLAETKEQ